MKKLTILGLTLFLNGCVGLAVGTFGTFEAEVNSVNISEVRNEFGDGANTKKLTKEFLISTWGEPDAIAKEGNCEIVTYYDGYNWSGIGAFVLVIPIPLMVPTGHDENQFYFINGESVGLVKEYGEVTGALGYMCGSNECKGLAGPVNTDKKRNIEVKWCG